MTRFKIACVFGTRPEAIKMAPIILLLQSMPELVAVEVICTGQHRELLIPLIEWFGLSIAKNMDVMQDNQGLNDLAGRLVRDLGQIFHQEQYDCVIGQGDTTTVFSAALAAFHEKIPFAHVEAGLRTYDRYSPFPEEMNRVLVGKLASIHFAPTEAAAKNLMKEGVSINSIYMTGNTVIDALQFTVDRLTSAENDSSKGDEKKIVFVTAHRRENFGEPLQRICRAIQRIVAESVHTRVIFSVHPNPNVRDFVYEQLGSLHQVTLFDSLPYPELVSWLQRCDIVLTDSGGLQEEAPALKKPVLVLRNETERQELIDLGGGVLVGSDEDMIVNWVSKLLTDDEAYQRMIIGYSPCGDGNSSQRIVDHLLTMLSVGQAS